MGQNSQYHFKKIKVVSSVPRQKQYSVERFAKAIFCICTDQFNAEDVTCFRYLDPSDSMLEGYLSEDGSVKPEALEKLKNLAVKHGLVERWKLSYVDGVGFKSPDKAQEFFQDFSLLTRIYWFSGREFICGHSNSSGDSGPGVYTQHPSSSRRWVLHVVQSGEVEFHWGINRQRFRKGHIIVIPPQLECRYRRAPNAELWTHDWYTFVGKDQWVKWLNWATSLAQPASIEIRDQFDEISRLSSDTVDIQNKNNPHSRDLQINYFEQLLIKLRVIASSVNSSSHDKRVVMAKSYIEGHYSEDFSIDEVASYCGVGSTYLNRKFKQSIGFSLIQWRDQLRIDRACELLHGSQLSIGQIAESVGYGDPQYFSRRFKSIVGCSPNVYKSGE